MSKYIRIKKEISTKFGYSHSYLTILGKIELYQRLLVNAQTQRNQKLIKHFSEMLTKSKVQEEQYKLKYPIAYGRIKSN